LVLAALLETKSAESFATILTNFTGISATHSCLPLASMIAALIDDHLEFVSEFPGVPVKVRT